MRTETNSRKTISGEYEPGATRTIVPKSRLASRGANLCDDSHSTESACSNKTFASSFSSSGSKWNCIASPSEMERASETLLEVGHGSINLSVTNITGIDFARKEGVMENGAQSTQVNGRRSKTLQASMSSPRNDE